ncbi:MAG: phosphoribosyl-AMP cyclohydrolase [Alphaproteobacteria bacterium]
MTKTVYQDSVIEDFVSKIKFDAQGLVPAVAQQWDTGKVLMLAWMDKDAVGATMRTGDVTYWSRARRELWRKGATSGHVQELRGIVLDCDGDALLLQVDQTGPACHTGAASCFFTVTAGMPGEVS